jgi:hypothetical protein
MIHLFPFAIVALQIGASVVYFWYAEWRLCIIWSGIAVSNWAFVGMK